MRRSQELLADLLGAERVIAIRPILIDLVGSANAAIMLQQGLYWTKRATLPGGWFYKVEAEWHSEIRLTAGKQRRARARLRDFTFWHEDRRGIPAKLYFRVDVGGLHAALLQLIQNRPTGPNVTPQPVTLERTKLPVQNESNGQIGTDHHFFSESTSEKTSGVAAPSDQAKYIEPQAVAEELERPYKGILKISGKKQLPSIRISKKNRILSMEGSERYPSDPLRAELWDGIYRKRIFDRFIDSRRLSFREQLEDCVEAGVVSLMENRKAKMLAAGVEDNHLRSLMLQTLTPEKEQALVSLSNFDLREVETVAFVIDSLIEAAFELVRGNERTVAAMA